MSQDDPSPDTPTQPGLTPAEVNALTIGLAPAQTMAQVYQHAATASQASHMQAAQAQQAANALLLTTTASGVNHILELKPKLVWAFVTSNKEAP